MAPWGGVPVACVLYTDCFAAVVEGDIPWNARCLHVTGGLPEGTPSGTYCTCSLMDFQSGVGCDDADLPGAYVVFHALVALLLLWFKFRVARTLFQGWRLGVFSVNAGIVVSVFALLSLLTLNTYLVLLLVQGLGVGVHNRVFMIVVMPFFRTACVGFYVAAMIIWRIEVQNLMARVHSERKAATRGDKLLAGFFVFVSLAVLFALQVLGLDTAQSGVTAFLVMSCAMMFVKVGVELRSYLGSSGGSTASIRYLASNFRRSAHLLLSADDDGFTEPANGAVGVPAATAAGSGAGRSAALAPPQIPSDLRSSATDRVKRAVKRIEFTVSVTMVTVGLFLLLEGLRLFGPDFRTSTLGPSLFYTVLTKFTLAICGYGVYVSGAFGVGPLADKVGEQRQRRKTQVITFETELQLADSGPASFSALSSSKNHST